MDADHKARILRDGPVGLWRTSAGSADALGADDVSFNEDGTGMITSRSLRSGTERSEFQWRVKSPGVLLLRCPADEEPGEPDYWWETPIEIRSQTSDLGEVEVLQERGSEGFWWLIAPLRWVGAETA